jgi:hypothetical protein
MAAGPVTQILFAVAASASAITFNGPSGSGSAAPDPEVGYVSSFNGRRGLVYPQVGDYTTDLVLNYSTITGTTLTTALNWVKAFLDDVSISTLQALTTETGMLHRAAAGTVTCRTMTAGKLPGVATGGLLADSDIGLGLADGLLTRTGGISVVSAAGLKTYQAAGNDAVRLLGRAGGTGSFVATLTPTTLTASRTYTLADADMVLAGSAAALTAGRLPGVGMGGILADTDISVGLADGIIARAAGLQLPAGLGVGCAANTQFGLTIDKTVADQATSYRSFNSTYTATYTTNSSTAGCSNVFSSVNISPATGVAVTAGAGGNAFYGLSYNLGAGTVDLMAGMYTTCGTGAAGAVITTGSAFHGNCRRTGAGAAITSWYGLWLEEISTTATITNYWGLYEDLGATARNYLKHSLSIGSTSLVGSEMLRVAGKTQTTGLAFDTATTLTIATGSVTATQAKHLVDTEGSSAADDVDTIVASGYSGYLLLRAANAGRVVTLKHNTGNIILNGADVVLSTLRYVALNYDTTTSKWILVTAMTQAITTQTIGAENVDFNGSGSQVKTITADTTLTTSNSEAGLTKTVVVAITASGATRNLTTQAAWNWLGTRPTSDLTAIADGSTAVIVLTAIGTTIYASGGVAGLVASYMVNPMTTAGDTIYGGTSGVPTRLAKGTGLQYYRMNSGATAPEWADLAAFANPMTTQGDTIYGGASGAATRLAKGTAGQIYKMNSGATAPEWVADKIEIGVACSDETTALTTGTAKITFRAPCAITLTAVRASVTTAPTGASLLTVDINKGGSTILSTKITIDASAKTSTSATTPAVISDTALASDDEITIDIDQVGSTVAGAGLKIWLIGTRA